MVKEGKRRVRLRIMSPNFLIQFSLSPKKSVCYCTFAFVPVNGKEEGEGGGYNWFFGAHVSSNVKLGDIMCRHTLVFPSFTIYFL
jgi:hypothetical protein